MKALYARALTDEERETLQAGLKSSDGFRVRRCQMILLSADEQLKVAAIGRRIGCAGQAVREAIHAFEREGLGCLVAKSRARHDNQRAFNEQGQEGLQELIRRSPREFGYESSLWTLDLVAQVSVQEGLIAKLVSGETVRTTLEAMGITWQRAKHWINSPDVHYQSKKSGGTG